MRKFAVNILIVLVLLSPIAYASKWPELFVSIDPALLLTNPGITQEINFYDNLGNTYVDETNWKQAASVSLALGLRAYQNQNFQINTSLRYVPVADVYLNGQIWQLKSPLFNDVDYNFHVRSNLLLIDNIISWTHYHFQPGLILGLGMSTNTTSRFQEWPSIDSGAISLQQVTGSRNHQFAYEIGAVLDYSMDKAVIEFAYRYMNAGSGYFQSFSLQNTADQLSTGVLNYHMLSIGIRAYYEL